MEIEFKASFSVFFTVYMDIIYIMYTLQTSFAVNSITLLPFFTWDILATIQKAFQQPFYKCGNIPLNDTLETLHPSRLSKKELKRKRRVFTIYAIIKVIHFLMRRIYTFNAFLHYTAAPLLHKHLGAAENANAIFGLNCLHKRETRQ